MKYNWNPVIKSLCKVLKDHNFTLHGVDDGEGTVQIHNDDWKEATEMICSVDESNLYVKHPSVEKRMVLFIVLGNEPSESVCDYSAVDILDLVVCQFSKKWENKKCPTID